MKNNTEQLSCGSEPTAFFWKTSEPLFPKPILWRGWNQKYSIRDVGSSKDSKIAILKNKLRMKLSFHPFWSLEVVV